jgi:hypothetical protein
MSGHNTSFWEFFIGAAIRNQTGENRKDWMSGECRFPIGE